MSIAKMGKTIEELMAGPDRQARDVLAKWIFDNLMPSPLTGYGEYLFIEMVYGVAHSMAYMRNRFQSAFNVFDSTMNTAIMDDINNSPLRHKKS